MNLLLLANVAASALLNAPQAAGATAPPIFEVGKTDVAIGLGLWAASEILSFMPRVRANGVIQLLLSLAIRAFPYEPPQRRREPMTLARFLQERIIGRRR